MAKLSVSVDVPLPPEVAWSYAEDLSRYKDWLTIHRVWRSKLPDTLEKGTVVESIVSVKGSANRVRWTIVRFKPPEGMTLNGDGQGGLKIKLIARVTPADAGSRLSMDIHLGAIALIGPLGAVVAQLLRGEIQESLNKFVEIFAPATELSDDG